MRRGTRGSWRFAEGVEQLSVVALYVRDALRLEPPVDAQVPPRLDPLPPERSDVLSGDQRADAAAQWLDWWRLVVAHEVRHHQGPPAGMEQRTWARTELADVWTLFDPPDFAASATRPALRMALRATFDEALRWADRRRASVLPPAGAHFDYDLVKTAAEDTIRQHSVDPDAVQACAVVLPVEGAWWQHIAPGAVVCSVHAVAEPDVARAVLADAFKSGLSPA